MPQTFLLLYAIINERTGFDTTHAIASTIAGILHLHVQIVLVSTPSLVYMPTPPHATTRAEFTPILSIVLFSHSKPMRKVMLCRAFVIYYFDVCLFSDYREYNTDTTVRFVATVMENQTDMVESDGPHKVFKLQSTISINSMVRSCYCSITRSFFFTNSLPSKVNSLIRNNLRSSV